MRTNHNVTSGIAQLIAQSARAEPGLFNGNRVPAAAMARGAAPGMSDRYVFIDTREVIRLMAEEGFNVAGSSARVSRRNAYATSHGLHLIDFRHPDSPTIRGVVPRVLFVNSHNGMRRARVIVGAFRLACSNGLIVGTTMAQEAAVHSGDQARTLVERMRALSKNTLPMFQQIECWSKKQLTNAQAHDFAHRAAEMRWLKNSEIVPTDELLRVRRSDDDARDLWSVFNRVQEATTALQLQGRSTTGRRVTTRPMREVGPTLKYNADLWRLAEEFAG